jgi:hypothetical protein
VRSYTEQQALEQLSRGQRCAQANHAAQRNQPYFISTRRNRRRIGALR